MAPGQLKAAMWVHGTAMEVENPDGLIPNGIIREGIGTHFYGHSKSFNWFHIPIPTPVVLDGHRSSLVSVFLFYQFFAGSITNVHVWDGPHRVRMFDNLKLKGNHLNEIDNQNKWIIDPPLPINYGLKLAIGVQFATNFDTPDTVDKLEFLVSTAGADFR